MNSNFLRILLYFIALPASNFNILLCHKRVRECNKFYWIIRVINVLIIPKIAFTTIMDSISALNAFGMIIQSESTSALCTNILTLTANKKTIKQLKSISHNFQRTLLRTIQKASRACLRACFIKITSITYVSALELI